MNPLKTPKRHLAIVLAILSSALVSKAEAQLYPLTNTLVYSTDFNGIGYTSDAATDGQNGWYTSSGNHPGPGVIRALNYNDGYGPQLNSFVLGGDTYGSVFPSDPSTMPNTQQTSLLHVSQTGTNSVFIRSMFDIYYSTGPRDTFGYSVFSSSGYDLLDILYVPIVLGNGATAYNLAIQSQANDNPTYPFTLQYLKNQQGQQIIASPNTWMDVGFSISSIGTTNQSVGVYTFQQNSTNYYGTTVINYSDFGKSLYNDGNTNVGSVGMSWILQDSATNASGNFTNYGNNTMIVQNLAISVPEPKTANLFVTFLVATSVVVVISRRRSGIQV
jgi:hypothetical protein